MWFRPEIRLARVNRLRFLARRPPNVFDFTAMDFEIIGKIIDVETIATSQSIRTLARLRKRYGKGRWRKRKGLATVRLDDGTIHAAEVHWYEAHGIGKKEFKIKFPLID